MIFSSIDIQSNFNFFKWFTYDLCRYLWSYQFFPTKFIMSSWDTFASQLFCSKQYLVHLLLILHLNGLFINISSVCKYLVRPPGIKLICVFYDSICSFISFILCIEASSKTTYLSHHSKKFKKWKRISQCENPNSEYKFLGVIHEQKILLKETLYF